jgi:hypothetical protein
MNATKTKLDEKEAYYIALWGDGEWADEYY